MTYYYFNFLLSFRFLINYFISLFFFLVQPIKPENYEDSDQRINIKSNTLPNKSTTSNALSSGINNSFSTTNNNNATSSSTSESPRLVRKRFESASDDNLKHENDDSLVLTPKHDLESFKADIIREIQIEIHKAKQEIIEGKLRKNKNYFIMIND